MILDEIIEGKVIKPPNILITGKPASGKTSFLQQAHEYLQKEEGGKLLCIDTDGGSNNYEFPRLNFTAGSDKTYEDINNVLFALRDNEHDFKYLAIDALDPLERNIIWPAVCRDLSSSSGRTIKSMEDVGYGKAYTLAIAQYWQPLFRRLSKLRDDHDIGIILVCHTTIKKIEEPHLDSYDQYCPKLHKQASALVSEWADAMLFACIKTIITENRAGKGRVAALGDYVFWTHNMAGVEAKNRYNLPQEIPNDFENFINYVNK